MDQLTDGYCPPILPGGIRSPRERSLPLRRTEVGPANDPDRQIPPATRPVDRSQTNRSGRRWSNRSQIFAKGSPIQGLAEGSAWTPTSGPWPPPPAHRGYSPP